MRCNTSIACFNTKDGNTLVVKTLNSREFCDKSNILSKYLKTFRFQPVIFVSLSIFLTQSSIIRQVKFSFNYIYIWGASGSHEEETSSFPFSSQFEKEKKREKRIERRGKKCTACLATSSLVKPVNDQLPALPSEPASAAFTCLQVSILCRSSIYQKFLLSISYILNTK